MLGNLRNAIASSSRLVGATRGAKSARTICLTACRRDVAAELDRRINQRDLIEQKKKAFEEKYGDQLKRRVEAEGVSDLEALKRKVMAPSVKAALKQKKAPESIASEPESAAPQKPAPVQPPLRKESSQAEGDRSGVKPLSSILNLPLLHLTPHDAAAISQIWTAYHTTHPTLSSSYLSASLPSSTYSSMLALAQANPIFVLPLPRTASPPQGEQTGGQVKTDEYEMFYLQWLFHPTPSSAPPSAGEAPAPLPPTTSVIFTPLEEYKQNGEWAAPHLVLTHYPDLASSHDVVLMRGEISAASASGPPGSNENPGWMLSQAQAQLLALALQRFYCAGIAPASETAAASQDRKKRADALVGFRERPAEWDWEGLVQMAYGGMV